MKIYGDPTANLIRNSVPSSTLEITSFSQGLPISGFAHQSGTNGAGDDGFVRFTSAAGGTVTGFMGFIYGAGQTATAKPGDKFVFSLYVRPSVTTNLTVQFEAREALMGVNVGWAMTTASNPMTTCPANVWTRLSGVGTVGSVAWGPGYLSPRPYLLGQNGTVYPAGFTYDVSSFMLTRGDTLIDFFSGNTAGCAWTSTVGSSVSYKTSNLKYYTAPDLFVSKTAYNELLNPRFANGTTLAPLWAEYKVLASAGSFSKTATTQTITATSIPAGGSFGVNATTSDGSDLIPLQNPVPSGSHMVHRVSVTKTGLAAGTVVNMRTEVYGADGTTLVGSNTTNSAVTTGNQFLSQGIRSLSGQAHYIKFYLYISAASNFTGTSSVVFSSAGVLWIFDYGYDVSIAGDGTFTGYSGATQYFSAGWWLGNPDESKSASVIRNAREVSDKTKVRSNVVNEIVNPRLTGSGATANWFSTYSNSGGTDVGTRSVSGGAQTINITSISGGLYRYGVSTATGVTMYKPIKAGTTIRAGYTANMTNSDGQRAGILLTVYYSDGTSTASAPATNHVVSNGSSVSVSMTIVPPKDVIRYTFYMYIAPTAPYTGNATIICTNPYVIGDPLPGTPPGYFNGSSGVVGSLGTAAWAGTVDASPSIIPYWATA